MEEKFVWINVRFDEMREMFGKWSNYPYPMSQRIYWLLMVKVVRELEEVRK